MAILIQACVSSFCIVRCVFHTVFIQIKSGSLCIRSLALQNIYNKINSTEFICMSIFAFGNSLMGTIPAYEMLFFS